LWFFNIRKFESLWKEKNEIRYQLRLKLLHGKG
jgi:hypothetical protein